MLRNQTFLSAFRHSPLRAIYTSIPRANVASRPQLLRNPKPQQRHISATATRIRPRQSLASRLRFFAARHSRDKRWNSGRPSQSTQTPAEPPAEGLSARFRQLSRRYGWSAVGVYLGLSVLDFPFCFLAVRVIGTERIGDAEHAVVDGFWSLVGHVMPSMKPEHKVVIEANGFKKGETGEVVDVKPHKDHETASIWTQLLLAYGVHKSLIFFRIPLTAAVTPKVVKTLRGWGWNIGKPKRTPRTQH